MTSVLLVCYVTPKIGLGHFSRLLALANELIKDKKYNPEFLIFGNYLEIDELNKFKVHNFDSTNNFNIVLKDVIDNHHFNLIVFDLYPRHNIFNLDKLFFKLKNLNIYLISIDSLLEHCNILDLIWIPSFNFNINKYPNCSCKIISGWDSYLINKRFNDPIWSPGSKILILTGGSDIFGLSESFPIQLDDLLEKNTEVNWVRGPFSDPPNLPKTTRLNWVIHDAPEYLDELIIQSNYVITLFGVSFFEVLQYGIPSVVFSPDRKRDKEELDILIDHKIAEVANDSIDAILSLIKLTKNNTLAKNLSKNALKIMSVNGTIKLSIEIKSLVNPQ